MKTVAITGATGFIGQALVQRHLELGDEVRVLTRRRAEHSPFNGAVEHFHGDLASGGDVLRALVADVDLLYHCAGEIRDPKQMHATNVTGTEQLIAASRGRIGRWVQLSSVGAYGRRSTGVVTEATQLEPQGPYEVSKVVADEMVRSAGAAGAFEHVILRPSIVFGPTMPNRSLFQWITLIARRLFFYVGPCGASANYIFVDNVVEALHRCAVHPRAAGQVYNLSDWRSIESFVSAIAGSLGQPAPRLRLPAWPLRLAARGLQRLPRMPLTEARVQALCTRTRYPSDKLVQELDYQHRISMEEGLALTVARWRAMQH